LCPPRRLAKLSFSHSANSRGWSLNLLFLFSQAPSRRLQIEAGYGSLSPANEGTTFGAQTSSINYVSSTPAMPNDTSTTATSSPYPSRPCLVLPSRSSTGSFVKGPLQGAAGKHLYLYYSSHVLFVTSIRRVVTMAALPISLQRTGLRTIHLHGVHTFHPAWFLHPAHTLQYLLTRTYLIQRSHILAHHHRHRLRRLIPRLANVPLLMNQRTARSKMESLNTMDVG
jgi:hypothetical protein